MTSHVSDEAAIEVLFVEDNPGDVRLAEEAFAEIDVSIDLHAVTRGQAALDYLRRGDGAHRPDVVLLDLGLPGMSGMEVLDEMEASPELASIPVIVLTNSQSFDDMFESMDREVLAYFTKPYDPDEYVELARSLVPFLVDVRVEATGAE